MVTSNSTSFTTTFSLTTTFFSTFTVLKRKVSKKNLRFPLKPKKKKPKTSSRKGVSWKQISLNVDNNTQINLMIYISVNTIDKELQACAVHMTSHIHNT